MDGCTLTALMPSADQIKTVLSVLGSVVISASLVTSLTPTPAPGTKLARIYQLIEYAALLFGRAKQTGVLPATPQLDKALEDALKIAKAP